MVAVAVLWAATALAQPGTVTGTMTVNGTSFPLRYVYATAQPGFFDKKSEDVRVLLTDVPLDEKQRTDIFAITRLARSGQLHGVEVVVDAKGSPMSGAIFVEAFNGMASVAGMHHFEARAMERKLIAGRMFTDVPHTFDKVTWQYDATFSAPIPRPPTAAETAAALRTPAGVAAIAHVKAIRTGFDAFVSTLTESSLERYRGSAGVDLFKEIQAETPPDSRVVSLTEGPDDTRIATVQGKRRDGVIIESVVKVRREGTAWKVER
jgi:hypothetical protein